MKDMVRTFPNIRICLLVGIGGGAPNKNNDIRLGDIVVSTSGNGIPSVVQYDFGKEIQDESFKQTGTLDGPPRVVRTAIAGLKKEYKINRHRISETIDEILAKRPHLKKEFQRPETNSDRLYRADVVHPRGKEGDCASICDSHPDLMFERDERTEYDANPAIHYGPIASANQLMKNALRRDELVKEKGFLCFEMEAAGLMNLFPCLVVRGICNYADTHANKRWQGYAALTAAAYSKDLLRKIPPLKVEKAEKLADVIHLR